MVDKQSRKLGTDGTTTRTMVVNIKSMVHVCSNTFLSIFLRSDTMVFWKKLRWLTKLTHQTLYREKVIWEVFWRQWDHGDWTLKTMSEIAFYFIQTTGFARIAIRTWFTETILIPIINVTIFIIIITMFPSLWPFCSIVLINTLLFCSIWHWLCIIMFSVLSRLFLCHYFFCCFAVAVFSLSLLMLLLLHVIFCFCCCYCCTGVVVFIVIGVRVVVAVVAVTAWLLPVLHHCFVFFMAFWISLSLSLH